MRRRSVRYRRIVELAFGRFALDFGKEVEGCVARIFLVFKDLPLEASVIDAIEEASIIGST